MMSSGCCNHCGHHGHHNSLRTCQADSGVRLFGVRLTDGVMRKSASMGNLSHNNPTTPPEQSGAESGAGADGYVSDGHVQTSSNTRERKKGVPWTEDEHRLFLVGLQKLGKGDWRGISRNFVQTRTPTQVASHAQKYFIRQTNMNKRKRRSSLFDIVSETGPTPILEEPAAKAVPDAAAPLHQLSLAANAIFSSGVYYDASNPNAYGLPVRPYLLPPPAPLGVPNSAGGESAEQTTEPGSGDTSQSMLQRPMSIPVPGSNVPFYHLPMWPILSSQRYNGLKTDSKVLRPTAKLSTEPLNVGVDGSKSTSQLNLGLSSLESSQLTLKLLDQPARYTSAFHVNSSYNTNNIGSGSNAISVV